MSGIRTSGPAGRTGSAGSTGGEIVVSIPKDENGRSDISAFAKDWFDSMKGRYFPEYRGFDFTVGSRFLRTFNRFAPFKIRGPLKNMFGPWADSLHAIMKKWLKENGENRQRAAKALTDYVLEETGINQSLAGGKEPFAYEPFSFETLKAADLADGGIKVERESAVRRRQRVLPLTSLKHLEEMERRGEIRISGNLRRLLATYPDREMTLHDVAVDLRRIRIVPVDPKRIPAGFGWRFNVVLPDGTELEKEEALSAIGHMEWEGKVSFSYACEARQVATASDTAEHVWERGLVFFENSGSAGGGGDQPVWLVGTGLGGEIASAVVEAAIEGGMNVYAPDLSLAGSKVSAALAYREMSRKGPREIKPDGTIGLPAGQIFVGEADALKPGRMAATVEKLVPEGAKALYAGMAYASGGGRELLLEAAQHAAIRELAGKRKISGTIRFLSPARAGIEIDGQTSRKASFGLMERLFWGMINKLSLGFLREANVESETVDKVTLAERHFVNATAKFQGLSYGLAQLFKVWAAEVETSMGLRATVPTAFITGTEGLLTPEVRAAFPYANRLGIIVAMDPASTGAFGFISIVAGQILARPTPPAEAREIRAEAENDPEGAKQILARLEPPLTVDPALSVSFDGGVRSHRFSLNSLFAEALIRSRLAALFKKSDGPGVSGRPEGKGRVPGLPAAFLALNLNLSEAVNTHLGCYPEAPAEEPPLSLPKGSPGLTREILRRPFASLRDSAQNDNHGFEMSSSVHEVQEAGEISAEADPSNVEVVPAPAESAWSTPAYDGVGLYGSGIVPFASLISTPAVGGAALLARR